MRADESEVKYRLQIEKIGAIGPVHVPSKLAGGIMGCASLELHALAVRVGKDDVDLVPETAPRVPGNIPPQRISAAIVPVVRFRIEPEIVKFQARLQLLSRLDLP